MKKVIFFLLIGFAFGVKADTLSKIRKNGFIRCGVHPGIPGFSAPDSKRKWKGLDVDVCKAVSSAVFGIPSKVKYVPLSAQQRFTALQSGEVDLLSRVTTWTLQRDTAQGLNFAPTTYYDGQGFMVREKDKIKTLNQLNGATVCVTQGTTTELGLADYFRSHKMKFKPITFEEREEMLKAFEKNRCDVVTGDASSLASDRTKLRNSKQYRILSEVISKEPLSPAVRHGDDKWFDIVKWTVYALVGAEEMGITSRNISSMRSNPNPKIKRFLGTTPGNGKALGLSENWAYNIIKSVGNYGEIFERNIGGKSSLKLKRGLNRLWNKGGLLYSPPMR